MLNSKFAKLIPLLAALLGSMVVCNGDVCGEDVLVNEVGLILYLPTSCIYVSTDIIQHATISTNTSTPTSCATTWVITTLGQPYTIYLHGQ